jgi:hypothetical protein
VCSVCSCPFHFAVSGGFDFALGCAVRNAYEARVFCLGRGTSSPCFGCPGFGRPAPACSGLHSSPSVAQESSRFSSWLRFCAEASLRVDFLVSHLARVVLIFYREFRFPSWMSLPGALRASTDSRSQIFGSFDFFHRCRCSILLRASIPSQRRAHPEISVPACPAQEVPHRAQFPVTDFYFPPGFEFASAPARLVTLPLWILASSLSTPVLA